MTSDIKLDLIFDYGDIIIVKENAPAHCKPASRGCICGVRVINSVEVAKQFNQKIDSELYLIEFEDGEALEIPKTYLIHLNP